MTVREILALHPSLEQIFDKHGLGGCGGPDGPQERLDFFAAVHKVDPNALLQELNAELTPNVRTTAGRSATETIQSDLKPLYPLFLRTSIILAATFGFSLGVLLLLNRLYGTLSEPLSSVNWVVHVQIHGAVQIYGWIGLFVMGMALHILPRFQGVPLVSRRYALAIYGTMLLGLGARVLAHPFPSSGPRDALLIVSSVALPMGSVLFGFFVLRTVRRTSRRRDWSETYLVSAVFWLVVAAVGHAVQMVYLIGTGSTFLPDSINEPVIHVALLGFAGLFAMGVSQKVLPSFLSLPTPSRRAMSVAVVAINAGLGVRFMAAMGGAVFSMPGLVSLSHLAAIVEAIGPVLFSLALFPWRRQGHFQLSSGTYPGYRRYLQAAYLWLVIAAFIEAGLAFRGLLGQEPSYLEASAGRHALALGYLTLMVTGFSLRVIPVFGGTQLVWSRLGDTAFWLLLTSVSLRVPFTLVAYPSPEVSAILTGVSGISGLLGLMCWGTVIWRTLSRAGAAGRHRQHSEGEPDHQPLIQLRARPAADEARAIRGAMTPAETVELFPATLSVFTSFGFDMLANQKMRDTLGRNITLEQAARMRGVPIAELLTELNEVAENRFKD